MENSKVFADLLFLASVGDAEGVGFVAFWTSVANGTVLEVECVAVLSLALRTAEEDVTGVNSE
jgi:hypothetical protein